MEGEGPGGKSKVLHEHQDLLFLLLVLRSLRLHNKWGPRGCGSGGGDGSG